MQQKDGGSIGLSLTGDVAKIYMAHWNKQLKNKLDESNITLPLHKCYVDDIDLLADVSKNEELKDEMDDKKVMEKVQEIANSIHWSIKTTIDYRSKHADSKLPMLDIKTWIGPNKDGVPKLMHEHYVKNVSTRGLMNSSSAHPTSMKRNVLVNEASRILRNCSSELEWEQVVPHLSYFARRMQYSGYPVEERYKVIKRAIDKYEEKENNNREEGKKRFTPSIETRKKRLKNKKEKRTNWSKKEGKHETVMFIEMTEKSELKRKVEIAAKKNKIKIKVQERPGTKLKRILQRSDPFSEKRCNRKDCVVCTKELGIDCRCRGCVYEIACELCENKRGVKNKYRGQTGRSTNERVGEHFDKWEKKTEDSVLWRHSVNHHNMTTFPVKVRILERCFGKPTRRMITEVVMIEEMDEKEAMNNKKEYGYVKVPTVNIET